MIQWTPTTKPHQSREHTMNHISWALCSATSQSTYLLSTTLAKRNGFQIWFFGMRPSPLPSPDLSEVFSGENIEDFDPSCSGDVLFVWSVCQCWILILVRNFGPYLNIYIYVYIHIHVHENVHIHIYIYKIICINIYLHGKQVTAHFPSAK